jgi:hypothetical protein
LPEFSILAAWLLALALGVRASWVWACRGRDGLPAWRGTLGAVLISFILLDCLFFIRLACTGEIGGFGTHYMTTRMVGWYFLASMLITAGPLLLRGESRWEAFLSGFLTTALWFGAGFVA